MVVECWFGRWCRRVAATAVGPKIDKNDEIKTEKYFSFFSTYSTMATIETAAAILVLYANGQCDAPIATWTTQKMGKNFRISSARSHDAKRREEKERNIKSILSIDEQSMANCVSATIVLSQSELKRMERTLI